MAPKTRNNKPSPKKVPGRSTRARLSTSQDHGAVTDDVSDVYKSMLAEAGEEDSNIDSDRPLKKRKVRTPASQTAQEAPGIATEDQSGSTSDRHVPSASRYLPIKKEQTVENSSDSDESEFEFEDVDLDIPSNDLDDGIQDLAISLEPESSSKRQANKRRPVSAVEKSHRVFVHKLHILCMLQHCVFVNGRCNNTAVQRRLRPLLTPKVVSFLNPKPEHSQFQRSNEFLDGLQQALNAFVTVFRVTSSGLVRARWESSESDQASRDHGEAVDRNDVLVAAKDLEGSQDLGNQLFCALLRAAGVEARLVCSLQTLPFTNPGKAASSQKPSKPTVYVNALGNDRSATQGNTYDTAVQTSAKIGQVPSARRRLGQPGFGGAQTSAPKKKTKPVRKLSYPVFWVEAFNTARQKWIPIDPLVTQTVAKTSKFEPPSSYDANQMSYVIAFESDGVARDVTKRYAKAYNAKTRRHRVEATGDDGARWWKTVTKIFRRRGDALDRDQVEDAEMSQKEAREGLPGNIQDFKDHPYYALERHLKRHEVINPRREVGKVNAGTVANPRMESVYRRQDVLVCRSADKWYRLGRIIQKGEQPLKQVPARSRRNHASDEDEEGREASNTTGMYALYQTEQYVPPPVQRGRITKNAYGNLDIYVPSMVPAGGTHITHNFAQRAARFLRIDYADAVTGFQFKGRHGTAIMNGVVVAEKYADAVHAIIEGFEDEVMEDESRARSLLALKLWKRFVVGLRIAERIKAYGDKSTTGGVDSGQMDDELGKMESIQDAGGFFPGEADETPLRTAGQYDVGDLTTRPKATKRKNRRLSSSEEEETGVVSESDSADRADEGMRSLSSPHGYSDEGGGFFADEQEDQAGETTQPTRSHQVHSVEGGGFLVDDDQDQVDESGPSPAQERIYDTEDQGVGGGFVVDDGDDSMDLFGEDGDSGLNGVQEDNRDIITSTDQATANLGDPVTTREDKSHIEPSEDTRDTDAKRSARESNGVENDNKSFATNDEQGSDNGSMLSHDPEDEDLDPDWLESD